MGRGGAGRGGVWEGLQRCSGSQRERAFDPRARARVRVRVCVRACVCRSVCLCLWLCLCLNICPRRCPCVRVRYCAGRGGGLGWGVGAEVLNEECGAPDN